MKPRTKLISLEKPALLLQYRHFESTAHGIVVIGTWLYDKENKRWQPCLALCHGSRPIERGKTVPCIIPLSESWAWAWHGDVGDPVRVRETVNAWLKAGYLPGSHHNHRDCMAVVDAVNMRLPDLITMPPRPKGEKAVVGEVTAINKDTGEIMFQQEVANDV